MVYLDRTLLRNQGDQSLFEQALLLFKQRIFTKRVGELRKYILEEIKKDTEDRRLEETNSDLDRLKMTMDTQIAEET